MLEQSADKVHVVRVVLIQTFLSIKAIFTASTLEVTTTGEGESDMVLTQRWLFSIADSAFTCEAMRLYKYIHEPEKNHAKC